MPRILHIKASPRTESYSTRLAAAFLKRYAAAHPGDTVETLDVFRDDLLVFSAQEVRAKYAVLSWQEPLDDAGRAWKAIIQTIDHFKAFDKYVLSSAMWNFSIPYRLKQYIDIIVQPGLTFTYDPQAGYKGLVTGRPAMLLLARGGEYQPGTPAAALDFQKPYLETILRFIGFTDIRFVLVNPTLAAGPEVAEKRLREAIPLAEAAAEAF